MKIFAFETPFWAQVAVAISILLGIILLAVVAIMMRRKQRANIEAPSDQIPH